MSTEIVIQLLLALIGVISAQDPQCFVVQNSTQCLFEGSVVVTSMADAELACNHSGGQLATFTDSTSLQQLINYLNAAAVNPTEVWLDAKETIGVQWNWIDGVKYNSAVPIPPSYGQTTLNYRSAATLRYVSYSPYFYARTVNETHNYICSYPTTGGIKSIVVNDKSLNWFDARQYCISNYNGGDLAKFDVIPLNSYSASVKAGVEYWIGLTDWQWTWTNGSSVDPAYTKTFEGEPGSDTPMCLGLVKSVTSWNLTAIPCTSAGPTPYICQTNNSQISVSTVGVSSSTTTIAPVLGVATSGPSGGGTIQMGNSSIAIVQASLSLGAEIGIGVGVGVAGLLLVILVVVGLVCFVRRQKDPRSKTEKPYDIPDVSTNEYTPQPVRRDHLDNHVYHKPDACKTDYANTDDVTVTVTPNETHHYDRIP